ELRTGLSRSALATLSPQSSCLSPLSRSLLKPHGTFMTLRKLLILLTITFVAVPMFGQWRRASLFGADVRALLGDPIDPDTLYLGTSSGEVYLTRDGAKNWTNPFHGIPFPGYVDDKLVVDRARRPAP